MSGRVILLLALSSLFYQHSGISRVEKLWPWDDGVGDVNCNDPSGKLYH